MVPPLQSFSALPVYHFPPMFPTPPPSPMRAQSGDPRTAARQATLWIFPGKILQWVVISFFTLL